MQMNRIKTDDLISAAPNFCRKLRLVLACGNYNYIKDGAVFALNKLVQYLEQHGAQVMIISPVCGEPAFESYGTVTSVPSLPLPKRSEYRLALPLTPHLRELIRAFRPNLFHVASPDPLGYSTVAFARQLGVPVVASYHSRHDLYLQYYHLGFLSNIWQGYLRKLYKSCDQVYAPSAEIVDLLRKDRLARDVRLWGRGVDVHQFNPARRSLDWRRAHGFDDDDVVVSFVSRLVAEKNIDLLIAVLQELELRGIRHRQLFVGEGPQRDKLAAALPRAVFTGHLDGIELATAYASSDVFFFPSITETFGIVTLEAMASGLPTVCSMATGTMSLVVPGETGYLIDKDDIAGFSSAIEKLVLSPDLRQQFGKAGVVRSQAFTWTAVMEALVENYVEAVDVSQSTSR
jgi:glycosyltransferase involved in cell wall biosynthesis